ncbi:polysaccharide deacetylase family protein [Treponema bryantii]|uniref:polysaccharide deacetylase family protein n=1 Tax=Treponema bryantii TaxID=163 RepID=UPI0003B6C52B|nr:polysaccharide deacetylase family protein [Treponema bryantii]
MKKTGILPLVVSLFSFSLFAGTSFGNPDLNLNDEILFTVRHNMVGTSPYKSLFHAALKDGKPESTPEVITCYPEQMELLSGGEILQIRNRYGIARYSNKSGELKWIEKTSEMPENIVPVVPYAVSPDGKYFCRIERTSVFSGNLMLVSTKTGKSSVLCEGVLNSYEDLPVKWAPDSSVLIYEKNNSVFFCNPDAVLRGVEIDERYRKIGRGSINSVYWASPKYLAYIDDYLLYKINTKELYTLGLYSGIIGQGKPMGRLPFQFNPLTDKFSCNSEVTSAVVTQNGRLFTYLVVRSASCDYMDVIYSRPYTESKASLVASYVFWDDNGKPVLWQEKLPYDGIKEHGSVYKLDSQAQQVLQIEDSGKPFISPNGSKVMFFAGSTVYVYDMNTWKRLAVLTGEKIVSAIWTDDSTLIVGGEKSVRKWNIFANKFETITLSSVAAGYWDTNDYSIIADTGNSSFYRYDAKKRTWAKIDFTGSIEPVKQNGRYRVFIGTTQNKNYDNAIFVRSLSKRAVTNPLYKESARKAPEKKKVALAFELYDNADGLPVILSELKKFNAKGSFFINGEFIRRYPAETRQIVTNGHLCASMFFTTANLTENSFVINEDFIRRGLARNEDEFYDCTKNELTLFWHAPYYSTTPDIINAGENAGYTYVFPCSDFSEFNNPDMDPEKLIRKYIAALEKTNGGVVSVVGGFSQSNHSRPLYKYVALLISALLDSGYELVDLNSL